MTRRRTLDVAVALACFTLAALLARAAWSRHAATRADGSATEWILGPFAQLLASAQWVRVDVALRESRFQVAYQRADHALALAPADPQGWIFYAHQLLFQRTALARDEPLAERARWAEAGIDLLERARRECAEPAEICLYEGGVFAAWGALADEVRPWPHDARATWERAVECFARARELGHPHAAEYEQAARIALREAER